LQDAGPIVSEKDRIIQNRRYIGKTTPAMRLPRWGTSLTPEEKGLARFRGFLAMAIDLALIGTIVGITNNRELPASDCNHRMVRWLYAFAGYLGA
jgi:hypothetical protein